MNIIINIYCIVSTIDCNNSMKMNIIHKITIWKFYILI